MKKGIVCLFVIVFLSIGLAFTCWAYDFSDMSNQELYEFRPSLKYATDPEKQTYWDEWDKRKKMMTAQEKEKYPDPDDPLADQKIKFLYSPGMGYEGPVSVGEGIYGSPTRPVYKSLEERQIYGIDSSKEEDQEPAKQKEEKQSSDNGENSSD